MKQDTMEDMKESINIKIKILKKIQIKIMEMKNLVSQLKIQFNWVLVVYASYPKYVGV
jgi:hypothetical protein